MDPIKSSYTTTDSGNAIREAETTAAYQQQFWSEPKGRKYWGNPLPESEVPPEVVGAPSTEGQLWRLWYAVLHAAEQNPWGNDNSDVHGKLVTQVATIEWVPDPPMLANATKALHNGWIWRSSTLWSTLLLLGPSSVEAWDTLRI
jgi:hypothetical protein